MYLPSLANLFLMSLKFESGVASTKARISAWRIEMDSRRYLPEEKFAQTSQLLASNWKSSWWATSLSR